MAEYGKAVPKEVKGWNWGAFMFNIVWGVGNKTYLPLLCFVPVLNIVWMFVCGFKGNEWAWQNADYNDVETFKRVQNSWNRAGLFAFVLALVSVFFSIFVLSTMMASLAGALMH
ncbi:ribonuclease G [Lonsdalea iberica]|uniref:Ribonuclease G n=1 Tax=Lonsdalea iberica TaxID=1082703 RepID=A0A1X3S2E0_9GAMM|nr:ribonuclease G [Lonsdalea iberica]OSN08738.1 ribonuclease G [Lonsdalea iberica]